MERGVYSRNYAYAFKCVTTASWSAVKKQNLRININCGRAGSTPVGRTQISFLRCRICL